MTTIDPTAIVTVPSSFAAHRGKHWAKHVTSVDTSRSNGYAFVGTWVRMDQRSELPVGAHVLTYDEETSSKGRVRQAVQELRRVDADGTLTRVKEWGESGGDWALAIRDEISALIAEPAAERELSDAERQLVAALSDLSAERRAAVLAAAQKG